MAPTKHVATEGFVAAQPLLVNAVLRLTCAMTGCALHRRLLRACHRRLRAHNHLECHHRCRLPHPRLQVNQQPLSVRRMESDAHMTAVNSTTPGFAVVAPATILMEFAAAVARTTLALTYSVALQMQLVIARQENVVETWDVLL